MPDQPAPWIRSEHQPQPEMLTKWELPDEPEKWIAVPWGYRLEHQPDGHWLAIYDEAWAKSDEEIAAFYARQREMLGSWPDSPMQPPRPDPQDALGARSEGRDAPGQAESSES